MAIRALFLPAALVLCAAGQEPAPDAAGQKALISRMREVAPTYGDRLQNFTCTQVTARSTGPSPTGTRWKALETQELELNYVDHHEHYRLLKVNGETTDLKKRVKSGFRGYGQFGSALLNIFDPKANAEFEWDDKEASPQGSICVFRYRVPAATSTITMNADRDHIKMGHHGTFWANCESGAVARLLTETETYSVRRTLLNVQVGYRLEVRYGLTKIASQEFLLPQSAIDYGLFYKTWTKEEIEFQNYRKYDANSTIKFDDAR